MAPDPNSSRVSSRGTRSRARSRHRRGFALGEPHGLGSRRRRVGRRIRAGGRAAAASAAGAAGARRPLAPAPMGQPKGRRRGCDHRQRRSLLPARCVGMRCRSRRALTCRGIGTRGRGRRRVRGHGDGGEQDGRGRDREPSHAGSGPGSDAHGRADGGDGGQGRRHELSLRPRTGWATVRFYPGPWGGGGSGFPASVSGPGLD